MSVNISIAYHSGFGHTERQARAVAAGAESAGATVTLHDVTTLDDALWSTLADADAIIFGSPTYMGTASAAFQTFAEASSPIWADGGWRDKIAAGFTNSAGINGDKLNTLETMSLFAAQHGMTWVSLASPPAASSPPRAARTTSTAWPVSWALWPSRRRTQTLRTPPATPISALRSTWEPASPRSPCRSSGAEQFSRVPDGRP